MNKNVKKSLIIGTPILAATTLGASLSVGLVSCSPEQIKSVLDRIFNAIKAVESLSGKNLGVSNETKNVITVQDLKQTLIKGFGLTEKEFNEGIKNINIDKKVNSDEWDVYVLLKPEYSWPKDVLESKYNSNDRFGTQPKEPKFYADERLLEFTISKANFDKVAVYTDSLTKELVQESLNQINGANDHTNDNGEGNLSTESKKMLALRLSSNNSNIIASSISSINSSVNFIPATEIQPVPPNNALINDSNANTTPPTDIENSSILSFENSDSKLYNREYKCNATLEPGEGFVFINANNEVAQSVTYNDLIYDQVDVVMGQNDIKSIYDALNAKWKIINEIDSFDELNTTLEDIKNELISGNLNENKTNTGDESSKVNEFFEKCLSDISTVNIGTWTSQYGQEYEQLIIKFSFYYSNGSSKKEINIKTFKYPSSTSDENGELSIKTDDWVNNIVLSNSFESNIPVSNSNTFFKV